MSADFGPVCTLEGIRAALDRGSKIPAPLPSAEAVGEAFAGAARLAVAAFRERKPKAQALAERVLHLIHVHSSFAPPIEPTAAAVWAALSTAKLDAELGDTREVSPDKLGDQLKDAVIELGAHNHPLVDVIHEEPERLKRWLKNWYASTHGYTYQMTSVAKRCAPESDVSAHVPTMFKNLSDELADEVAHTPHHILRMRILERAGTHYDLEPATTDPDIETEAFSLQSYRTIVTCIANPMFALGSVYGIEANWVLETVKLSRNLRRLGFEDFHLTSTDLHSQLDIHHAQEWLDMVIKLPLTPKTAGQVVAGARAGLRIRRAMYDAVAARAS